MNENELKALLLKYYNGECTDREEDELFIFFNSGNVPEGYEAEKAIFSYFADVAPEHGIPVNLEQKVLAAIDQAEKENSRRKRFIFPALSAAAAVLLLLGSWFFFSHRNEIKDTYSDPRVAYAETLKILYDISSRLNDAEQALEPVSKITSLPSKSLQPLSRPGKIVEKTIEDLGSIHKAIEPSTKNEEEKSKNN